METTTTRDQFILDSLRRAAPMIQNIATRTGEDFSELYQVAAVEAVALYERAQGLEKPEAYLQTAIRYGCFKHGSYGNVKKHCKRQLSDYYQILSLSTPLTTGTSLTLQDTIADTASSTTSQEHTALYQAMNSLPDMYRIPLCMRYGLCGYGISTIGEIAEECNIKYSCARARVRIAIEMIRAMLEREETPCT